MVSCLTHEDGVRGGEELYAGGGRSVERND